MLDFAVKSIYDKNNYVLDMDLADLFFLSKYKYIQVSLKYRTQFYDII
jgi:hypothetical protein